MTTAEPLAEQAPAVTQTLETGLANTCTPAVKLATFPEGRFVRVNELTDVKGTLYFTANVADGGHELWRSDGTPGGTYVLRDLLPPDSFEAPTGLIEAGGRLFFTVEGALWRSDGTASGTLPVAIPELTSGIGTRLEYERRVIVTRRTPAGTMELWLTNGTRSGTRRLAPDAPEFFLIGDLVVTKSGYIFFEGRLAEDPFVFLLYRLSPDGTLVELFRERDDETSVFQLTAVDDRVFFLTDPGDRGEDYLWTSDGTPEGTRLAYFFGSTSTPGDFTAFDGRLFFRAEEGGGFSTMELWVSDGTPEGTHRFADINPGPDGSIPSRLTVHEGTLYFSADDGVHGFELWKSDGTVAGTRLAADIHPGPDSSFPYGLVSTSGKLYFAADDGVHGFEPWKVFEGRARLVEDVTPGPASTDPYVFTFDPFAREEVFVRSGSRLYFAAGAMGDSLWTLPTGSYCPVR